MTYVIEKNMPVVGRAQPTPYPFKVMVVGDSFLVPCQSHERRRMREQVRYSARFWKLRNHPDWIFAVRQVPEGVRVWRTK